MQITDSDDSEDEKINIKKTIKPVNKSKSGFIVIAAFCNQQAR